MHKYTISEDKQIILLLKFQKFQLSLTTIFFFSWSPQTIHTYVLVNAKL